jgi:hypothetical protein
MNAKPEAITTNKGTKISRPIIRVMIDTKIDVSKSSSVFVIRINDSGDRESRAMFLLGPTMTRLMD